MNPEKHLLDNIPWQFFCTFTFKSLKLRECVLTEMYIALLRVTAQNFRVHPSRLLWALRHELGEQTQRPHFHALIAGLPASGVNVSTCFSLMKTWENLGGGIARVRIYDPTLTGVEYVLKGVDEAYFSSGANWYELGKFGSRCDVMLSMSLIRHLRNRSRFGHRDNDGLFGPKGRPCLRDRRALHRVNRARLSDESRGTDTTGDTLHGPVRQICCLTKA